MKKLFLPVIAIFVTYFFDKLVDFTFNLGPYNDSATPRIVFLIELVLIVALLILFYLIHVGLIVRFIDKKGNPGYRIIFVTAIISITIISLLLARFVYSDSNLTKQQVSLEGIRVGLDKLLFADNRHQPRH